MAVLPQFCLLERKLSLQIGMNLFMGQQSTLMPGERPNSLRCLLLLDLVLLPLPIGRTIRLNAVTPLLWHMCVSELTLLP